MSQETDAQDTATVELEAAAPSAAARSALAIAAYRWRPGQSGNPHGTHGVLARRIRHATNQGRDLIDELCAIALARHADGKPVLDADGKPRKPESVRYRLDALKTLFAYAFGKPIEQIKLEGLLEKEVGGARNETHIHLYAAALSQLAPEQLQQFGEAISTQMAATAARERQPPPTPATDGDADPPESAA